jgi:hypothetical protein
VANLIKLAGYRKKILPAKKRLIFASGHGTKFEAQTGIKTHWHEYEAA